MPAFAQKAGGMLTDNQVAVLAQVFRSMGNPSALAGQNPPPYLATLPATPSMVFKPTVFFALDAMEPQGKAVPPMESQTLRRARSFYRRPSYLAVISDQNLRSITIAGRPDLVMPDWRSDADHPMTDQQVTDILAWLASKRVSNPGQPYPNRPNSSEP